MRRGLGGSVRAVLALAGLAVALSASACAAPLLPSGTRGDGGGSGDPADLEPVSCATPVGSADFATAGAQDVGLDRGDLARAVGYASARGAQSVRVYRHGCLVARSGNDPLTENMRLPGWSMTKGVVSMVVGRAEELGLLSVDDPISAYLDTAALDLDPAHASLTPRHFLTQTSGLRMAWVNDLWAAGSQDSVADVLSRPFQAEPGSTFLYAQTAVSVLVAVVEGASGEDFQDFARRELFEPIGIPRSDWRWQRDAAGTTQGFAFLDMTPTAWARLGHLLLREGRWGTEQLLDPVYIQQGRTGTTANAGYGFLWRTNSGGWNIDSGVPYYKRTEEPNWPGLPRDAFALSGLFDQIVIVVPSLDMVVVRLGLPTEVFGDPLGESPGIRPSFTWRFDRLVMAAVADTQVHDPGPWSHEYDDTPLDVSNIIEPALPPFEVRIPGSLGELFALAGR